MQSAQRHGQHNDLAMNSDQQPGNGLAESPLKLPRESGKDINTSPIKQQVNRNQIVGRPIEIIKGTQLLLSLKWHQFLLTILRALYWSINLKYYRIIPICTKLLYLVLLSFEHIKRLAVCPPCSKQSTFIDICLTNSNHSLLQINCIGFLVRNHLRITRMHSFSILITILLTSHSTKISGL